MHAFAILTWVSPGYLWSGHYGKMHAFAILTRGDVSKTPRVCIFYVDYLLYLIYNKKGGVKLTKDMDLPNILISFIALINLFLGIIVYWKREKNYPALWFSFLAYSLVTWCISIIGYRMADNVEQATILAKLVYGSALLIPTTFFYFTNIFPHDYRPRKFIKIFTIISLLLFLAITLFTSYVVEDVEILAGGEKVVHFSLGYLFFIFFFIGYFIAAFGLLIRSYRISTGIVKAQIYYVLFGALLATIVGTTTNLLLPTLEYFGVIWVGPVSTIIMATFIAYAISRYQLMDIKVILTEILVGAIALLLLVQVVVSESILEYTWKGALFLIFLIFGYLLIRSVIREIERRAELQKLYKEVDKLSKAKSEFISIASHQLRTPLTAIKGYISMIIEGTYGKLSGRLVKPLGNVYQSNERLIKLVNDLLNLSRLEAGKLEFKPEPTSLEKMVSNIAKELKINAEKKGLYVRIVKPPKLLPKIMVDRDKLRQVILNIIDNAIKYTKKGGITIELKKLDSREQIKTSDTGEGMDKKEIKSLFQMFSRATAGTQLHREGAGIGLYVAKRFLDMHNGKIWAESKGKGKGSTFYIELPIKT